jgi:hypothetical protein
LIVATTFGVTNLLGFLGGNLADTMNYVSTVAQEGQSVETQEAFDTIRDGAWGTLIVVIITLCAAAVGGLLGRNDQRDLTALSD